MLANTLRRYRLRKSKGDAEALGSRAGQVHESLTAISQQAARSDDVQNILELTE